MRCGLRFFCLALGFLMVAFLGGRVAHAQPAFLVKDINPTSPMEPFTNFPRDSAVLNGIFYFVNDDVTSGSELWRTDGTSGGTWLVKDICPGSCPSAPYYLTVSGGQLFFSADDGEHGPALWKTDGTAAGTVMVADLYPGLTSPFDTVSNLLDVGGVLFFLGDDGVHGPELWKTDGTTAGTQLVKDIWPGPIGSYPRPLAASGGLLLFAVNDGSGFGTQPWVSDGTAAGTIPLGNLNPNGSSVSSYDDGVLRESIASPQGGFLFAASDSSGFVKLWSSDGTPGGTVLLKDVTDPHDLTPFNGAVYFAATGTDGSELWKTDGTTAGTVMVKDLWTGGGSDPRELTVVGNRLFFLASDGPSAHGIELWTSDGTAAGTTRVTDLVPGGGDAFPYFSPGNFRYHYGLSALAGHLVFLGFGPNGLQLWSSDGTTAGTVPLSPTLSEAAAISDDRPLVAGGRLYFRSGSAGSEIWSSDGTAAGTHRVTDGAPLTSAFMLLDGKLFPPSSFAPLGSLLFFQASDGSGFEPWRSDGTPGGTTKVATLGQPGQGSSPSDMSPFGNQVLFSANGTEAWASDGTAAGTQLLASPAEVSSPFLRLGGAAFFLTLNQDFTTTLWKTDGTAPGTVQVASLGSGYMDQFTVSGSHLFLSTFRGGGYFLQVSDGTGPGTHLIDGLAHGFNPGLMGPLADVGGTLFFTFAESGYGWELWKSDGTAAGTTLVKILQTPNSTFTPGEVLAAAGGLLFFAADDGQTGPELWKSDGTEAGTVPVADIRTGPLGSEPLALTPVGNRVFFTADDGVHGREIWVSDGTAAGTHMVADVLPGPDSSRPDNLTAVGSTLLFSAYDGAHGVEAWRTGGTALGTRMIQDIAPGPLSSSPTGFTAAGPNVYFAANDNTTGFELWAVPQSAVLGTFADVPPDFWAWRFIEALARSGITSGCGNGSFCPDAYVTRAQMAVFLLTALHTSPPPATGTLFNDVPLGYWAGPWIEELAREGVVSGCSASPPLYCPESNLTRAEMAVLLTLARHENPPPATGTRFADVPADYWAARFIEQLAADGITGGCDATHYCPDQPVTRGQMAVFLATAFHLPLP